MLCKKNCRIIYFVFLWGQSYAHIFLIDQFYKMTSKVENSPPPTPVTYRGFTASLVKKYVKSPHAASLSVEVELTRGWPIHKEREAARDPRTGGGVWVVAWDLTKVPNSRQTASTTSLQTLPDWKCGKYWSYSEAAITDMIKRRCWKILQLRQDFMNNWHSWCSTTNLICTEVWRRWPRP